MILINGFVINIVFQKIAKSVNLMQIISIDLIHLYMIA